MSANHDLLTDKSGRAIVSKIVSRDTNWGQIFSDNIHKVGDFGWPRPDYVCYDFELNQSLAFEFKPPSQTKREYLTGLGQAIAYLGKHHYSGLILPTKADGFPIAEYISDILSLEFFRGHHTLVVSYDESTLQDDPNNSLELLRPITDLREEVLLEYDLVQTYWCWWRDISHFEIYTLLNILDKHSRKNGDIYTEYAWPEFWEKMVHGQTRNWEGKSRNIIDSPRSKNSYKQNTKIPLFQLSLIEQSEGRLTSEGYKLIALGKIFGPRSSIYLDYLTKLVLVEGKHLTLIHDLQNFKNDADKTSLENSTIFKKDFEKYLNNNNSIGPRKPGRKTTGKKNSYIRDEFKLWNKLNLLNNVSKNRYFTNGEGIRFNWSRITDILTKNFNF